MHLALNRRYMQTHKEGHDKDYEDDCLLLQVPNEPSLLTPNRINIVSQIICLAFMVKANGLLIHPVCTPSFARSFQHGCNTLQRII